MTPADLLRGLASALEATDAEMDPAIRAVVTHAPPGALAGAHDVLLGAIDRLRQHPTPAQGAADLRRLADEVEGPRL